MNSQYARKAAKNGAGGRGKGPAIKEKRNVFFRRPLSSGGLEGKARPLFFFVASLKKTYNLNSYYINKKKVLKKF